MRRTTFALLFAMGLLASGCTYNPATDRSQFLLLSTEEEIALGAEAMPQLVDEYGGEVSADELSAYVSSIGNALASNTEAEYPSLPWEFTVLDSDVINAFALPGGKVFLSRGLMSFMENEAQLAAVLGHEIGHVTSQHADERISHAMGVQAIAEIAGAAGGGEGWVAELIPVIVGTGGQGYLLKFGRDQEREADRQGMKYMTAEGYDPMGMVQLLDILVATSGGARQPEILSTHPNPESRREDALALLNSQYAQTQDNPRFQLHADRFAQRAKPHLPPPARTSAGELPPPAFARYWCAHCRLADAF